VKLAGREIGNSAPLFLIAGPCVIESRDLVHQVAGHMVEVCRRLGLTYVFKASFDKANRSSARSFRGPRLEQGMAVLEEVRRQFNVPVLTDVHEDTPLTEVASVVDVLQTPAFLCRQTNFIQAVARCGRPVNIKKGQFCRPGKCRRWWRRRAPPAMPTSWSASAGFLSATTIWWPTCARWP
jgi:2-dehydro-3-deoxyphosphooctonate aldolase (KDO 8-P synthase)